MKRTIPGERVSGLLVTAGLALAVGLWAGVLQASDAGSQSGRAAVAALSAGTDEAFCGDLQKYIVRADMAVENIVHKPDSYEGAFRKAKPLALPLTSHQFVNFARADGSQADFPVSVSCKMKTTERIHTALQESGSTVGLASADGELSVDRSCKQWTEELVQAAYQKLESAGATDLWPRDKIVFEEDGVSIGPFWLNPHPYQTAYAEAGMLHLRSKSLHVEYRRFMPVPDSFMGTHYCHLITPEYLSRLISREETALPQG